MKCGPGSWFTSRFIAPAAPAIAPAMALALSAAGLGLAHASESDTLAMPMVLPDSGVCDSSLLALNADPDAQSFSAHPVKRVLEGLLLGYRLGLSRLDGPTCGFYPSCSRYGSLAIRQHGPRQGILMTGDRLLRCHPDPEDDTPRLPDGRRIDWPH